MHVPLMRDFFVSHQRTNEQGNSRSRITYLLKIDKYRSKISWSPCSNVLTQGSLPVKVGVLRLTLPCLHLEHLNHLAETGATSKPN